jgi:hypothetical protein
VSAASTRRLTEWLGTEFLKWWTKEYRDTPPYRQGGTEAVAARAPDPSTRAPRQVSIRIASLGELPPAVTSAITAVQDVEVLQLPRDDEDDYESLDMQTLLEGTVRTGPAVGALVTTLRDSTRDLASVRQVELVVDGRNVPLSRLTDAEVAQLLPELTG